jgi:hypothetical protein
VALALAPLGPWVLFYLAAAVSDFFMPWPDMVRFENLRRFPYEGGVW